MVRTEHGSYMLELGLVLFGAAFFILGAADVASILQAREAARTAVQEGLRCLYPTEGGCSYSDSAPFSPARYDAWTLNPTRGFQINQQRAFASAGWKSEPLVQAVSENRPVSSVDLSVPRNLYERALIHYPVEAHARYLLQKSALPYIAGTDPLNPDFVDALGSTKRVVPASFPITGIKISTRKLSEFGDGSIAEAKYYEATTDPIDVSSLIGGKSEDSTKVLSLLARPENRLHCIVADRLNSTRSDCVDHSGKYLVADNRLRVPMMIRVLGNTQGTDDEGLGKLQIFIEYLDAATEELPERNLGGRIFDDKSSGALAVRGATEDIIEPRLWGSKDPFQCQPDKFCKYAQEVSAHGILPLVTIRPTTRIRFRFYLASLNGKRVQWNGEKIQIFVPTFSAVDEVKPCGYSPVTTQCETSVAPMIPTEITGDRSREVRVIPISSMCSENRPDDFEGESARRFVVPDDPVREPVQFSRAVGACEPLETNYPCKDGTSLEYYEGCDAPISTAPLESGCNLPIPIPEGGTVTPRVGTAVARASRTVRACSDGPVPACAKPVIADWGVWRDSAGKECAAARVHLIPPAATDLADVNTCEQPGALEAALAHRYRRDNQVPAEVDIPTYTTQSERFSIEEPGECSSYKKVDGGHGRLLCASGVTEQAGLSCCLQAGGGCDLVKVSDSTKWGDTQKQHFDDAVRRAADTVHALYPRADVMDVCEANVADCASFTTGFKESEGRVSLGAKISVPLRLLSLFNSQLTMVEYSEETKLERSFLK